MVRVTLHVEFEEKTGGKKVVAQGVLDFHGCTMEEIQREFVDDILGDNDVKVNHLSLKEVH